MSSCDRLPKLLAEAYEICEVQRHFAKCLKTQEVVNTVLKECYVGKTVELHLMRLLVNDGMLEREK